MSAQNIEMNTQANNAGVPPAPPRLTQPAGVVTL